MIFITVIIIRSIIILLFLYLFIYTQNKSKSRALCVVLLLYFLFNLACIPSHRGNHSHNPQKDCRTNIRVIESAVEMYNMDSSSIMNNLDIDILIKGHYLKEKPIEPDKNCEYFIEGDLSKDGYVYCARHGDMRGYKPENESYVKKESSHTVYQSSNKIWSWEVNLDNYFMREMLASKIGIPILYLLGIYDVNILNLGGLINMIICLSVLCLFIEKKEKDKNPPTKKAVWKNN